LGGSFGNRQGRRVGESVGVADDKGIKGIFRVQHQGGGGVCFVVSRLLFLQFHLADIFRKDKMGLIRPARHLGQCALQIGGIFSFDKVSYIEVG